MKPSYTSAETIHRACESATRSFYAGHKPGAELADQFGRTLARIGKADRAYRLVKAAKSPTDRFPGVTGLYFNRPGAQKFPKQNPAITTPTGKPEADHTAPDLTQPGTWAVVERRDWCQEHRIRLETRPGAGVQTPDNSGERWTDMLTERGARKISEACYYMACQRGGFTTFATLTLNDQARERMTRQGMVPKFRLDAAGHPLPPEAARAKPGSFSLKYHPVKDETPAYNVAELNKDWKPVTIQDPDFGPLRYNPLKEGYVWSLQKEVSRFFEAANKIYQRGWQYKRLANRPTERGGTACDIETRQEYQPLTLKTVKVAGSRALYCAEAEAEREEKGEPYTPIRYYKERPPCPRRAYRVLNEQHAGKLPYTPLKWWREPLAYLWVAENPNRKDDNGKPLPICDEDGVYNERATNPHIHIMMAWRVERKHFRHWAARLEKLWGHGTNHLEKIKDPQKAGSYVAKAAGYLCKAQGKSDQGEIRGNRYGIAARARAPGWIECERHQVGMMGWLLAEAHELWSEKHGEKIQRREQLKYQLAAANDPKDRQKIGRILEATRKEIKPLPRISKYAALFKSEKQKDQFIDWARRKGWTEKPQCSLWLSEWRKAQWERRQYRIITRIDAGTLERLEPDRNDVIDWMEMADSGSVACDDDEDRSVINDTIDYFEGPPLFEQQLSSALY